MPARPAAPTPRGLAMALDLPPPADDAAAAALLPQMATIMLRHLAAGRGLPLNRDAAMLAAQMEKAAGWPWAPSVIAALGGSAESSPRSIPTRSGAACRIGRTPARPRRPPASMSPPPMPAPAWPISSATAPSSGRSRPTTPPPPPAPSPRGRTRARRMSSWPRPGPAPARPSAISPRPASGRNAMARRSGSAPSPATCSGRSTRNSAGSTPSRRSGAAAWWSARAARITSAC